MHAARPRTGLEVVDDLVGLAVEYRDGAAFFVADIDLSRGFRPGAIGERGAYRDRREKAEHRCGCAAPHSRTPAHSFFRLVRRAPNITRGGVKGKTAPWRCPRSRPQDLAACCPTRLDRGSPSGKLTISVLTGNNRFEGYGGNFRRWVQKTKNGPGRSNITGFICDTDPYRERGLIQYSCPHSIFGDHGASTRGQGGIMSKSAWKKVLGGAFAVGLVAAGATTADAQEVQGGTLYGNMKTVTQDMLNRAEATVTTSCTPTATTTRRATIRRARST